MRSVYCTVDGDVRTSDSLRLEIRHVRELRLSDPIPRSAIRSVTARPDRWNAYL